MIEPVAEAAHLAVQFFLAGMGEGRMADVVTERQSFGQVLVQFEAFATVRAIWETSMV